MLPLMMHCSGQTMQQFFVELELMIVAEVSLQGGTTA